MAQIFLLLLLVYARGDAEEVRWRASTQSSQAAHVSVLRLSKGLQKDNPDKVLMIYREDGGHSTPYEDAMAALEFVLEKASK